MKRYLLCCKQHLCHIPAYVDETYFLFLLPTTLCNIMT